MELTLDNLIALMEDVNDEADYEHCTSLVDDRVLTSFDILAIIGAIDDEFDIAIPAKDIVPGNFNSAQALLALVQRLDDEE